MNNWGIRRQGTRGLTMLETVGVLSIAAIAAAMLIPRIIPVVSEANVYADVQSIKSVRSAAETYFQAYGRFGGRSGDPNIAWTTNAYDNWDRDVLVGERLLEKPFVSKLATRSFIRLTFVNTNASADPVDWGVTGSLGNALANNASYDLIQNYACAPRSDGTAYALARRPARCSGWNGFGPLSSGLDLPHFIPLRRPDFGGWTASALPGGGPGVIGFLEHWGGNFGFWDVMPFSPIECAIKFLPRWSTSVPVPMTGGVVVPPNGSSSSASHTSSPPAHNDATPGTVVVEAVLQGVSLADAYRLSMKIDGFAQSNWAYWDSQGRVKYNFGQTNIGTVFIYIAHK